MFAQTGLIKNLIGSALMSLGLPRLHGSRTCVEHIRRYLIAVPIYKGRCKFAPAICPIIPANYAPKGNTQNSLVSRFAPFPFYVRFSGKCGLSISNPHNMTGEIANARNAANLPFYAQVAANVQKSLYKAKVAFGMVKAWMEGMVGYRSMAGLEIAKSTRYSNGGTSRQDVPQSHLSLPLPIHTQLGHFLECRSIHSRHLAGWSMELGFPA